MKRVDEPELGKPELDKLVLGKMEVGFDLGSRNIYILSTANGGWTIRVGMRTTTSFTIRSNCFHLLVNLKNSHKVFVDFRHFSAAISVSKEEVIELDDSLRWAEVSQS
nr:hypothetical protein [Tanacetum cinerariifolium]